MTYHIRPAERSQAKPLIGLYSESGCGKTWSALMLARGFVGPTGSIVMIETEAGRGEVYADLLPGGYDVCSMREIFSPENYGDAIQTVEQAGADALIIDSASHEWEGSGGVLAMAAANEAAGKKSMMILGAPQSHRIMPILCRRRLQQQAPLQLTVQLRRQTVLQPWQAKTPQHLPLLNRLAGELSLLLFILRQLPPQIKQSLLLPELPKL